MKLHAVTVREGVVEEAVVEIIAPFVERVMLVNAQPVTVEVEGREKSGCVSVVSMDGVTMREVS